MWYSSDEFDARVRSTHTACAKIEVWNGRNLLLTSDEDPNISIAGGSVTVQRKAEVRRSLNATVLLSNTSYYRTYLDPLLGYDVMVSRGVIYADDTREYVPLGVFKLDTVSIDVRENGLMLTVTGFDRARMIAKNPWTGPFSIASGTEYTAAMQAVINSRASGFTPSYNMVTSALTTPALFYSEKDNPWQQVQKFSDAIGHDVRFDNMGVATSTPIVDPTTAPVVLDVTAGETAIRVGNLKRSVNVTETYNGVIVRGSAPWLLFPVTGEAWDDDPSSPTWRGGPYGSRPKVIDSAVVSTNGQAAAAAQAELFNTLGATEQIVFNMLPDPRYDVNDVVRVYDPELSTYSRNVIDQLTIPLLSGEVVATTRQYSRSVNA